MKMQWQAVKTQIRLLPKEQSDLGLHMYVLKLRFIVEDLLVDLKLRAYPYYL